MTEIRPANWPIKKDDVTRSIHDITTALAADRARGRLAELKFLQPAPGAIKDDKRPRGRSRNSRVFSRSCSWSSSCSVSSPRQADRGRRRSRGRSRISGVAPNRASGRLQRRLLDGPGRSRTTTTTRTIKKSPRQVTNRARGRRALAFKWSESSCRWKNDDDPDRKLKPRVKYAQSCSWSSSCSVLRRARPIEDDDDHEDD